MTSQTEVNPVDNADANKTKFNFLAGSSVNNSSPSLSSDLMLINAHDHDYILIVDDEYDIVHIIKHLFEKDGFQTCIYTDPLAALSHFKSSIQDHNHSVVISDIRMPVMNLVRLELSYIYYAGYEFIKQIKSLDPNARTILMSSLQIEDNELLNVLPEVKIDGFIQKPFSVFKLKRIIERFSKKQLLYT